MGKRENVAIRGGADCMVRFAAEQEHCVAGRSEDLDVPSVF